MGISVQALEKTFNEYNGFAEKKNDPYGKKYFHNLPFTINDEFYASIVTPVLHYTMGGLEITHDSEVLGDKGVIPGLFAAGGLCGGVHGANRLGGSSLLGCVVYGRVAGDTASRFLFGSLLSGEQSSASRRAGNVAQQLLPGGFNLKLEISITIKRSPYNQPSLVLLFLKHLLLPHLLLKLLLLLLHLLLPRRNTLLMKSLSITLRRTAGSLSMVKCWTSVLSSRTTLVARRLSSSMLAVMPLRNST